MPEIIYRSAEPKDFLKIAELDRTAWGKNRHSDFIPDGEHIWRIWCEYAFVEVAYDGDVLVGVGVSIPTKDSKLYFHHKLFIREDYRGQGIGLQLTANRIRRANEVGAATLFTTDSNNEVMQHVGEKLGYEKVEFVKGYYRPEEDRYLMKREPGPLPEGL